MVLATSMMEAKVERAKLASCMTCPLCHRLVVNATTISECLHTFCRKCIYEKIIYEYLRTCPVCKIYLGCAPLEKLRADNSLQDLRCKIFPSKRRKSQVPQHVPEFHLISRRKERSISSLVVSPAGVSTNYNQLPNTKATTHLTNIIDLESDFPSEDLVDESIEDQLHDKSLDDRPSNFTCSGRQSIITPQNPPTAECYRQSILNRTPENNVEVPEERSHFVKRFGHLIQYVSKTKPNKFKPRKRKKKSSALEASRDGAKVLGSGNGDSETPTTSPARKPRRPPHLKRKGPVKSEESSVAQAIIDANRSHATIQGPIWFSLVASEDLGEERLPQIASSYLVKISVRGQPVRSTVPLQNLVDWWLHTSPAYEPIQTSVGSSAKDFVMVLSYSRNVQQGVIPIAYPF